MKRQQIKIASGDLDFHLETKRNDKFGSLSASLNTMRQQIKSEQDRRNRFFMGVSHDLMTPLAHISGYSEALLEGLSQNDEMTTKYLKIINGKAYQMEQRITRLLNYLKTNNSEFQQDLEKQSIAPFLRDFLRLQEEEQRLYKRDLTWNIEISENILVSFNEDLLARAMENLIQNSFKYGAEGKTVKIETLRKENNLLIQVINQGTPIPPETLKYIFEPFFRGDKIRQGDGFGLGLSSVKSIIDSHGWEITVQSTESETLFCINNSPLIRGFFHAESIECPLDLVISLHRVDQALYTAEDSGRNRTEKG